MRGNEKGVMHYLYLLILILLLVLGGVWYFYKSPVRASPCYADCASINYECGSWRICGEVKDCGKCGFGTSCNSSGKCNALEIGLENEWGENKFWFVVLVIIIPILIIIFLLVRMWLHNRKHYDSGDEVVRWGPFRKVVVAKKKSSFDRLIE